MITATTTKTVMCVEDERVLLENIAEIIRGEGYKVRDFYDSEKALDFLEHTNHNIPDVIVLDINMPQMSGIELAKRIKGLGGRYKSIPIIMLTAMSSEQYRNKAAALDVSEYMIKPVDYDTLLDKLKVHTNCN